MQVNNKKLKLLSAFVWSYKRNSTVHLQFSLHFYSDVITSLKNSHF